MGYATRAKFEPLREVLFGGVGATYGALGKVLVNQARIVMLQNLMDTAAYFSVDGTNDHILLPPEGFVILDLTANKVRDDGKFLAIGTQFYVKYATAPASGSVTAAVIY